MKQLFMLRTRRGGPVLKSKGGVPYLFTNKQEAKAVRNALKVADPASTVVVSYGPDHRLFKGE